MTDSQQTSDRLLTERGDRLLKDRGRLLIGCCKGGLRGVKGCLMLQYYVKRFSTENYQSAKADSQSGRGPVLVSIAVISLAKVLYCTVKA